MVEEQKNKITLCLIAGEHSGDALGGKLIEALKQERPQTEISFIGLGGDAMIKGGLTSLFPMEEVAVMGPTAIIANLPSLIRRVYQCVDFVLENNPDALIIIDSPELTHAIAKRVRRQAPHIPIINYVSPTIWAWRPGRAAKMKPYVDEVLALLPFEPAAHKELGGPSCHYVGHPLIEKKSWLERLDLTEFAIKYKLKQPQSLVVLPGSRTNEIKHLMAPFGKAMGLLRERIGPFDLLLPTVSNQKQRITTAVQNWPIVPQIIEGEEDKFKSFAYATAALAASGTVTLELALCETPMIVTYRYDRYLALLKPLMKAEMFALANHVLGEKAFPELIQKDCTPENIADHLAPLFGNQTKERHAQLAALSRLVENMSLKEGKPSAKAAELCFQTMALKKAGKI